MEKITVFVLTAAASAFFAACGAPATNAPANNANTNTNTAKPVAAAPTSETLFAIDKAANEAWIKGNAAYFEGMMAENSVSFEQGQRMTKSEMISMMKSFKCDVKTWDLSEPQMAMINADTYVMSYKGTFDGSCTGPDGKAMKLPSPTRASSIYVRDGDKWKGAFHTETMIIDPKAPPAAPPKTESKKEEPKKEEAKKDDKANTPPAKAAPSSNTDALVKLHSAGWDAFKAKDAKWFDANLASGFALVDPLGGYIGTKAAVIKNWTETMQCEGITKVGVSDGFSTAISPAVEILTLKGTADGKCGGQPNGPIFQSAVYVKEGDAWKLAFMFESPAM